MKPRVKIIIALLCAVLIAVLLRVFAIGSYSVPFEGMEPSLHKGERILVNKWNYKRVKRGDIIVFHDPSTSEGDKTLVGRVMAMPGDVIYMDHAFNFRIVLNNQVVVNSVVPVQYRHKACHLCAMANMVRCIAGFSTLMVRLSIPILPNKAITG